MRRMYIVGLCLMAVVAFSAVAVGSAYAEPEFTNATAKFPLGFKGGSGKVELTTKNSTTECEKMLIIEGIILAQPSTTSSMLGDIQFLFDNCKLNGLGGGKCGNDPNLASGNIKTPLYLWHIGLKVVAPNGLPAVLIVILTHPKTVFSCENSIVGNQTMEVEGNLVGLILDVNAKKEEQFNKRRKTIEVEFKQVKAGEQEDRTFVFTLPKETFTELDLTLTSTAFGKELFAEQASYTLELEGGNEAELKA